MSILPYRSGAQGSDPNLVARQEKLTSVSASMSTIYKDMEEHTKVWTNEISASPPLIRLRCLSCPTSPMHKILILDVAQSRRELHENRLVSIEQSITRLEKHFQGSIKTVRDGLKEASEVLYCPLISTHS